MKEMDTKTIEIELSNPEVRSGYINITQYRDFFEGEDNNIDLKCKGKEYPGIRITKNQITGLTKIHSDNEAEEGTKVIITKVGNVYELTYSPNASSYESNEKMKKHSHSQPVQRDENCKIQPQNAKSLQNQKNRISAKNINPKNITIMKKRNSDTPGKIWFCEKYLPQFFGSENYIILKGIDEKGNVINCSDKVKKISCDVVVEKDNTLYCFELKTSNTRNLRSYTGGVSIRELVSAMEYSNKPRYKYYFVHIMYNNNGYGICKFEKDGKTYECIEYSDFIKILNAPDIQYKYSFSINKPTGNNPSFSIKKNKFDEKIFKKLSKLIKFIDSNIEEN